MRKLLYAGIYRRVREPLFWVAFAVCVLTETLYGISMGYSINNPFNGLGFDDFYFFPVFVALGVFISMSQGREYSDGTIRNKIIAGHSRTSIFLSEVLLNLLSCSLIFIVYFSIFILVIHKILPPIPVSHAVLLIFGYYLVHLSYAVLHTVVGSLIPSRAVGVVASMVLFFATMMGSYQLESMLGQPEKIAIESWDEERRESIIVEEFDNPRYLKGAKRTLCQVAENVLPYSHINQYCSYMQAYIYSENPDEFAQNADRNIVYGQPLYSFTFMILLTGIGLAAFRKKDFK